MGETSTACPTLCGRWRECGLRVPSEKTKHPLVRREGSYPQDAWIAKRNPRVPAMEQRGAGKPVSGLPYHRVEQDGEWRKESRTQTLLSGSAVALHYQSGPLEVSAAPHSLLPKSGVFQHPWVPQPAGKRGGSVVRSPRPQNSGGWGGGDLKELSHALAHTLRTKKGHSRWAGWKQRLSQVPGGESVVGEEPLGSPGFIHL